MFLSLFIGDYLLWHYLAAPKEILHLWRNFVWFCDRYFSIGDVGRSFFSPWRRITEPRHQRFNFEDWIGSLIINTLSRLIGMVMRTILILAGLSCITIFTLGMLIVFLLWFLAPALVLLGHVYGVVLLVSTSA